MLGHSLVIYSSLGHRPSPWMQAAALVARFLVLLANVLEVVHKVRDLVVVVVSGGG